MSKTDKAAAILTKLYILAILRMQSIFRLHVIADEGIGRGAESTSDVMPTFGQHGN
jgi:hypothetical protein